MRALVLESRGKAGPALRDVDMPMRSEGQALVKMIAASINRVDLYMRDSGVGITHSLPQIMGVDGVGQIVEVDPGAGLSVGDRVLVYPYEFCGRCRYCLAGDQPLCVEAKLPGEHRDGTIAEYLAMPTASLVAVDPKIDAHGLAALGVAYLTAWRMVFGKVAFAPGCRVLVQGAGGGVSYAAAQLAQMAGGRVAVSTTGAEKLAHFREIGFTTIDYASEDLTKAVLAWSDGEGVDLAIDNVGEASWGHTLRSVRRGGSIVTCGATTGAHPSADLQRLFIRQIAVYGSTMGSLNELRALLSCVQSGRLQPRIDRTYHLEQARDALERLSAPDRLGKVIVRIGD